MTLPRTWQKNFWSQYITPSAQWTVEENGAKCFRGNILSPVHSTYRGREDSLRHYLSKHGPGLSITAETSRCQWHGESMDYNQAIEAMQFLDSKAPVAEPLSVS